MAISAAIWVFVIIVAVVAVFVIRFLNQLTKVAVESESTIKSLNERLPVLLDNADKILNKADATVDRVNCTMDELEGPIHYLHMFTHLAQESKRYMTNKTGKSMVAILAGFKAARAIIESLKSHWSGNQIAQSLPDDTE